MNPELSIIIVHHQTPELLKLCLKSIKETSAGLDYEVIVIDSTISRKARDLINELYLPISVENRNRGSSIFQPNHSDSGKIGTETKYLPFKENLGYARGVNTGIANANGDYILILNPDIIVTESCFSKMLEYMKKHPDIGLLGPRMLNFNGSHQKNYFSFYKPATIIARRSFLGRLKPLNKVLDDFLMADADPAKIQTPDWLMGSALMVNRKALEKVGPMDERFFMYFEDVDWARRFWHNDYKVVYYPEAAMYHYHQRESNSGFGLLDATFNRKTRWHIRSAIKFFWKYRDLRKIYNF